MLHVYSLLVRPHQHWEFCSACCQGAPFYSNSLVPALDHLNVEKYLRQIPKTRACEYDRSLKTITPEYRSKCSGSTAHTVNVTPKKKKKESVRACCSYVLEVAGIDSKFSSKSRNELYMRDTSSGHVLRACKGLHETIDRMGSTRLGVATANNCLDESFEAGTQMVSANVINRLESQPTSLPLASPRRP